MRCDSSIQRHATAAAPAPQDRGTWTASSLGAPEGNNDAPGLVAEIRELRATAGDCDFDVKKCKHQNNGLPCAPLREACKRPCGAFSVKLYGAAGATIREGVLMHLWGSSEAPAGGAGRFAPKDSKWRTSQHEGSTLADPRWLSSARHYAKRNAWFVTVLREPVQRVWSRYWYDKGGVDHRGRGGWMVTSAAAAAGAWAIVASAIITCGPSGVSSADTFGPGYSNGVPRVIWRKRGMY